MPTPFEYLAKGPLDPIVYTQYIPQANRAWQLVNIYEISSESDSNIRIILQMWVGRPLYTMSKYCLKVRLTRQHHQDNIQYILG